MNAFKRRKMLKMARFMAGRSVAAPAEVLKPLVLEPKPEPATELQPVVEVVVQPVVEAVPEPVVEATTEIAVEVPVVEKPVSKKKKGL